MRRRPPRPGNWPALAAPLREHRCECPDPDTLRGADGKRRCMSCRGLVEREPRLEAGRPAA